MNMRMKTTFGLLLGAAVLAGPLHWELGVGRWDLAAPLSAQAAATNAEWRTYGSSLASTRYSALDQISAANFSTLEVAWRLKTDNLGPRPEFNFQSTPLMIGGTLYTTAGSRRAVVALDAATGEMKWMSSLDEGKRGQKFTYKGLKTVSKKEQGTVWPR